MFYEIVIKNPGYPVSEATGQPQLTTAQQD